MSLSWPFKDPDEVLDYQIDWTARLAGDTISTSDWDVEAGITMNSESNTTTTATIWISGGTSGEDYTFTNHIVTADGREEDAQITFVVSNTF